MEEARSLRGLARAVGLSIEWRYGTGEEVLWNGGEGGRGHGRVDWLRAVGVKDTLAMDVGDGVVRLRKGLAWVEGMMRAWTT